MPGGCAAYGTPQGLRTFYQRWHAGRQLGVEAFARLPVQRRYPMRTAARGHAFLGSSPYLGGRDSIVAQADAGAPENVLIPALLHEGRNARPKQHNDRTATVIRMSAGTAHLGQRRTDAIKR